MFKVLALTTVKKKLYETVVKGTVVLKKLFVIVLNIVCPTWP